MKKLLALVLALVMTLSLCITSNAAYDGEDFDYEEAVEVMSKLGVFQGNEAGKFNPKDILTREQAAKIVTYMILGKADADKLTTAIAPYGDVEATRWSAGSIAYCTSEDILAGVGNGKFDPTGKLTGLAFAKMCLVALGYDVEQEGLVGADWSINTAKLAVAAGLTDDLDIALSDALTREQAAQMALNTEKAVVVAYTNGTSIKTSDGTTIKVGSTRYDETFGDLLTNGYKTGSNDGKLNFCEKYAKNLTLDVTSEYDDFDRPARTWEFKHVSFGTYAEKPTFTYTKKVSTSSNTNTVLKDLGLKDYSLATAGVTASVNGKPESSALANVAAINALTANGTVVEVYTSSSVADTITNVVVTTPQLMQVNKVNAAAKTVTLTRVGTTPMGQNVNAVDEDNDCYAVLSAMKADDYVVVTPVYNGTTYDVFAVAEPTVNSGVLTNVSRKSGSVNGVTVAGAAYSLAGLNDGFSGLSSASIDNKTECKVFVDAYGYAMYIKDVTSATNYAVAQKVYSSLVDGKIVTMVTAVGTDGSELTFNLGSVKTATPGTLYSYANANDTDAGNGADTTLSTVSAAVETSGSEAAGKITLKTGAGSSFKASDVRLVRNQSTASGSGSTALFASDVNFLYLDATDNYKLTALKTGVQKVSQIPANSYALFTKVGSSWKVSAVVIAGEADDVTGTNVAYISAITGNTKIGTKAADVYTIYIDGVKTENCISKNTGLSGFVTYAVDADGYYTLKAYAETAKTTSVLTGKTVTTITDSRLLTLNSGMTEGNAKDAVIIDLTSNNLSSLSEINDLKATKTVTVAVVYNGSSTSDAYNTVSYIFVTAVA